MSKKPTQSEYKIIALLNDGDDLGGCVVFERNWYQGGEVQDLQWATESLSEALKTIDESGNTVFDIHYEEGKVMVDESDTAEI